MKKFILAIFILPFMAYSQHFSNESFSDTLVDDVNSSYYLSLDGDFSIDHILDIELFQIDQTDTTAILFTTIDFEDIDPEDISSWSYENGHLEIKLGTFLTGTYYLALALKNDDEVVVEELVLD